MERSRRCSLPLITTNAHFPCLHFSRHVIQAHVLPLVAPTTTHSCLFLGPIPWPMTYSCVISLTTRPSHCTPHASCGRGSHESHACALITPAHELMLPRTHALARCGVHCPHTPLCTLSCTPCTCPTVCTCYHALAYAPVLTCFHACPQARPYCCHSWAQATSQALPSVIMA